MMAEVEAAMIGGGWTRLNPGVVTEGGADGTCRSAGHVPTAGPPSVSEAGVAASRGEKIADIP